MIRHEFPAIIAKACVGTFGPIRLSDIGDLIVVGFGLLLWVSVLFSVASLGMREMFGNQHTQKKRRKASRRQ